ncbi:MAG: hypothetical protein LUH15_09455 [Tannerellaceae bacterium]|nr:hypothetical protein [Tannerellaceae bacterium]
MTNHKTSTPDKPVIEYLHFAQGMNISGVPDTHELIFILTGQCEIVSDMCPAFRLLTDQFVFLSSGTHFHISFHEDCRMLIMRLDPFTTFYGFYTIKELYEALPEYTLPEKVGLLTMNSLIRQFSDNLHTYIRKGINHPTFHEIKIKELLLLVSKCYSKKKLCHFFRPALHSDSVFIEYILNNWKKSENLIHLQQDSGYNEVHFIKKFEDIFGTSPQKWLQAKKASTILDEITCTYKPFELLIKEYGFDSPEQFREYCLVNFNQTPECLRGE